MKLQVLYTVMYDYTTSSCGSDSHRTEHVRAGSVDWDGVKSPVQLIEEKEKDFMRKQKLN